jgi:TetR/AcrR family transcriptional repressor of nem operon
MRQKRQLFKIGWLSQDTVVARPREFDTKLAIQAATETFWQNGYEATSIQDLMEAMDLRKGSLYNSFGDKHELFLMCLTRYLEQGEEMIRQMLESEDSPRAGLVKTFGMVKQACNDPSGKGCLGVNSMTELAPHDAKVTEVLKAHLEKVSEIVRETVFKAQEIGEFRADVDPADITKMLMTMQAGLLSSSKSFLAADDVEGIIALMFSAVES